MSLTGDRAAIAAALSTVDGVNGHEYRPTVPRPGDAWPMRPTIELVEGLVWQAEWQVIVFLPQNERAADAWADANFLAIVTALRGPGFATLVEPGQMATSGGDQFVLMITLRSE